MSERRRALGSLCDLTPAEMNLTSRRKGKGRKNAGHRA
jgi:hypothetical protein